MTKKPIPHPLAEYLHAYADGLNIQVASDNNTWVEADLHTLANGGHRVYRIKPDTVTLAGIEFPKPVSKLLSKGQQYWVVEPGNPGFADSFFWLDDPQDIVWLKRNLIQLTEEGAIAQAKAMIAAIGGKL